MEINFDIGDMIKDQVSNFIWLIITLVGIVLAASIQKFSKRLKWFATSVTFRLISAQIAAVLVVIGLLKLLDVVILLIALSFILILIPIWMLSNFRKVGIASVFLKTSAGIDFDASLKLAQTDFQFLGIGAHKLVSSSEFEPAMERCSTNGRTAKFLLSDPENPSLERMARRNNIDPAIYKARVNESIQKLARLRDQRGLNIDIRLYKNDLDADYQRFRLLFVDNNFCIFGWTIWGAHEGKENPQIILKNNNNSSQGDPNIYKVFRDYYDAIWEQASNY